MNFSITFDVEPDLHSEGYKGITEGIPKAVEILNRHKVKGTFFVTCDCIEQHPEIFKKLQEEGHEIALHGYRHVRYEELNTQEKHTHLTKALLIFRKYLGKKPRGFRAPQHSIDDETLNLLEEYEFKYDSSRTPLNFLQLIFFPEHYHEWKKDQTKNYPYMVRPKLKEIPTSSFVIPFVSLVLRTWPKPLLWIYLKFMKKTPVLVFYAHSWDFIELPESRTDRLFSHKRFMKKLDYTIEFLKKHNKTSIRLENV